MRSKTTARRVWLRSAVAVCGGVGLVGLGTPAVAAPANLPDVAVSMKADKSTYAVDEAITITVTITNVGTATARHVRYEGGDGEGLTPILPQDYETTFDLTAGATKTIVMRGVITSQGRARGSAFLAWEYRGDNGDANDENNVGSVRVSVPGAKGDMDVHIHQTTDGIAYGTEPGLAGVKVSVLDERSGNALVAQATSDATGLAHLTGIPANSGGYLVRFVAPPGWKVDETRAQIFGDSTAQLIVGAVPAPVTSTTPGAPTTSGAATPAVPISKSQGGLPVTGSNVATIGGVGAGLLVLGGLAFLAARRRRLRFVATDA